MDEALQAFQAGDLPKAIDIWTSEATLGDSDAQYILGTLYYDGNGVSQSYNEAVKWFLASAEQGYVLAQNALANMYFSGKGVPVDNELAAKWWLLAAEKGMSDSQNNIAIAYRDGLGVTQDSEAALKWFEKAAFQGDVGAMISLGGVYHEEGDSEMAYVWWYVASTMNNEAAQKNVKILEGRLTPEQIEKAQTSAKKILYRVSK
jgi:TPR repeat protein